MKIEKVTRRAQEQFQMVLEEQSRLTRVINCSVFVFLLFVYILFLYHLAVYVVLFYPLCFISVWGNNLFALIPFLFLLGVSGLRLTLILMPQ